MIAQMPVEVSEWEERCWRTALAILEDARESDGFVGAVIRSWEKERGWEVRVPGSAGGSAVEGPTRLVVSSGEGGESGCRLELRMASVEVEKFGMWPVFFGGYEKMLVPAMEYRRDRGRPGEGEGELVFVFVWEKSEGRKWRWEE